MGFLKSLLILGAVQSARALSLGDSCENVGHNGLIIKTTSGELHGFINSIAPHVRQFLGIPYAEAPLGSLRFQRPKARTSTDTIRAQKFAPSCIQQLTMQQSDYTDVRKHFAINGPDSEDCLYLNIFAPSQPKSVSLPVLIFFHGYVAAQDEFPSEIFPSGLSIPRYVSFRASSLPDRHAILTKC